MNKKKLENPYKNVLVALNVETFLICGDLTDIDAIVAIF